jgi:RNA polymerase sigma-70 factor (sigma-E family)
MDTDPENEFRRFVVARSTALLGAAYALTGNQQAAEDLLQMALAKTARRWRAVHTSPEAYVRRVMYRDQVSLWRRRKIGEVALSTSTPEPVDAGDIATQASVRIAVREALRQLPPRQRTVLVLRFLEDRSEAETADLLGISKGAVASQASRALARLRVLAPHLADGFHHHDVEEPIR